MVSPGFDRRSNQGVEKRASFVFEELRDHYKIFRVSYPRLRFFASRHFYNLMGIPLASALHMLKYRPDVVDFNMIEMSFGSRLFKKCSRVVVTVHDLIFAIHPEINSLIARVYSKIAVNSLRNSDAIVVVSSQTKTEVADLIGDNGNIFEVPNGVDDRFVPLENKESLKRKFYGTSRPVIGFLGGLGRRKRPVKLIKEFLDSDLHNNTTLAIWGDGPLRKKVEELSDGVHVKYMGFAPFEDLVKIYNSFDAFVFPSQYEGFGLPILEAAACGIPVFIYSDARIPREVSKYARSIETLEQIRFSRKSNWKNLKKEFSWKKTAAETKHVYDSLH